MKIQYGVLGVLLGWFFSDDDEMIDGNGIVWRYGDGSMGQMGRQHQSRVHAIKVPISDHSFSGTETAWFVVWVA